MIRTAFNGFFMALADSVPGVSGGTIALILGFYDNFIGSINKVIYGSMKVKKDGIIYLLKLFCGWAIGMILAVLVLTAFFEKNIYAVSSLFLGFVLPSVFVIGKEEYKSIRDKWEYTPFVVIGAILVMAVAHFATRVNVLTLDLTKLSAGSALYLFIAGAIAISAMFLPGISGSTVLLVFGAYLPVLSGVKEILHLNFSVLPMILIFGLGIITGALLSVKGIQKCLEKFRGQTVMLIIGMLIGSLYAIVTGPATVSKMNDTLNRTNFNFLFFIIGIALIFLLETAKYFVQKKSA